MISDDELIARVREHMTEMGAAAEDDCIEALDTLARRLEELEEGLRYTTAEENTTPHYHRRTATWDDTGKPCQRCLMFDRTRSLLHPEPQGEEQ